MTHRHYGLRWTKRPWTDTGPTGESATPFVVGIVAMMIVLGVVLYGISKTVIDVANTTASPAYHYRRRNCAVIDAQRNLRHRARAAPRRGIERRRRSRRAP